MKILETPQFKTLTENKKEKQNIQFKGTGDYISLGLRFLDTNQAWGANAVDVGSMVLPRTTVDFINRGPAAGMETGRREASGTINHSLIGVYGSLAALAFSLALNKTFNVRIIFYIFLSPKTRIYNIRNKRNVRIPTKNYKNYKIAYKH